MIAVSRPWLSVISLTFGTFLGVVGILRFENFHNFAWAISASAVYFVCLLITTLAFKSSRLPTWAAWLNVAAAIYVPIAIHGSHIGEFVGDHDTWYVTALALIFGAMVIRGQLLLAIFASLILVAQVLILGGLEAGVKTLSFRPLEVFCQAMLVPSCVFAFGSKSGNSSLVTALPKLLVTGSFGNEAVAFLSSG